MNRLLLGCVAALLAFSGCPKPCQQNAECDDGAFCNGQETCVANKCAEAAPVACDDGVACTVDTCSEQRRSCISTVPDVDGDGSGAASCRDNRGMALGDDCDDNNANRFPGNLEVCDVAKVDEDCDPRTIGDIDDDGDGYVNSGCANTKEDGGINRGLDCDDTKEAVHPGQAELCNFVDDNCNGTTDEGVTRLRFKDEDQDGYGTGAGAMGCVDTPGTSAFGTDCDDTNPAMHPGEMRCAAGSQLEYELCTVDGGFARAFCVQSSCRPQPNGRGLCL